MLSRIPGTRTGASYIVNTVLVVPIILILLVTALIVVLITGGLNTNHASVANGVTTLVKKTVVVEIPADQMIEGRSDFPPNAVPWRIRTLPMSKP